MGTETSGPKPKNEGRVGLVASLSSRSMPPMALLKPPKSKGLAVLTPPGPPGAGGAEPPAGGGAPGLGPPRGPPPKSPFSIDPRLGSRAPMATASAPAMHVAATTEKDRTFMVASVPARQVAATTENDRTFMIAVKGRSWFGMWGGRECCEVKKKMMKDRAPERDRCLCWSE